MLPYYHPYQEGDQIWLEGTNLHTSHLTHKLRLKWFRLFEIIEKLSPVTYCLSLPSSWKIHNTFLLSPYYKTWEYRKNYPAPAPDLIEGEPKWEVEGILASRQHGRKWTLQYLVKWKGYPESHNSWELVENLQAPTLV
jgi:hypothetical protein